MNKRITSAIQDCINFPTLTFDLVVIMHGNKQKFVGLTASSAKKILEQSDDMIQLVTSEPPEQRRVIGFLPESWVRHTRRMDKDFCDLPIEEQQKYGS